MLSWEKMQSLTLPEVRSWYPVLHFAVEAAVAPNNKNCATTVSSNEKIEIRRYGLGQVREVKCARS